CRTCIITFRAFANPGPVSTGFHEMLWLRVERSEDRFSQRIEGERVALCGSQRFNEGCPELNYLNKIVGMSGLQRRILPTICKAQQARGLTGFAPPKLRKARYRRGSDDGGGGRAAGLAESHQLAKVALAQIIGRSAAKAQHEGSRLPPRSKRTLNLS